MIDIGDNPFDEATTPKLDPERKEKLFAVARDLKKSCYQLKTTWLYDTELWVITCIAKIDGVIYESTNYIDDFKAKDHADMFRHAFSQALKEAEKEKKGLVLLH